MIVVRYADDLVLGFQYRTEAERFLRDFQERLAKFGLELHVDKTRLIESGRLAIRADDDLARPRRQIERQSRGSYKRYRRYFPTALLSRTTTRRFLD